MPRLPIPPVANTIRSISQWSAYHPFVKSEAEVLIDRWNSLSDNKMAEILAPMPDEWMNEKERDILCAWWSSNERIIRGNDAKRSLP